MRLHHHNFLTLSPTLRSPAVQYLSTVAIMVQSYPSISSCTSCHSPGERSSWQKVNSWIDRYITRFKEPTILKPSVLIHPFLNICRDDDFGSSFDSVSFTVELVKWGIAMTISYYLTQVFDWCLWAKFITYTLQKIRSVYHLARMAIFRYFGSLECSQM